MMGAYNRNVSRKKALRKRRISNYYYWIRAEGKDYYDNLHQYSKNKIHSSHYTSRTRNKGSRRVKYGNYDRAILYCASDLRKVVAMDEDLREAGYFAPKHKRNRYA